MKHLSQKQNAFRLNAIINKLGDEMEWFRKFIVPNAILEKQSEPVANYLSTKILIINRYLEETEAQHIVEKKLNAESKIEKSSNWEMFSIIKEIMQALFAELVKSYPYFDLPQHLKMLDELSLPIHVVNNENLVVSQIKSKAEHYLLQGNISYILINQDIQNSYFNIKSARAYYLEASLHFKRLGDQTSVQNIQDALEKLDDLAKKYKNNVHTNDAVSTIKMLRELEHSDQDIKEEGLFDEKHMQDCILSESMSELNDYHEEILIPLSPDMKYRRILALDIDDTIIVDGRIFHPDLKCINIDELAKSLRNTPPDVMVVFLTARYFPEFGNQDARRVAEELNAKVDRKIVQSIVYACAKSKPLQLRDLFCRHLQCQANKSHADIGLLDDKIGTIEKVKKEGYVGILVNKNNLDHFKEIDEFVKKPDMINQQIQQVQPQPTVSFSKI